MCEGTVATERSSVFRLWLKAVSFQGFNPCPFQGIRNEDGTISARKKQHTVLSKIGDQWTSGPISILHKALTNKLRVKVILRYCVI